MRHTVLARIAASYLSRNLRRWSCVRGFVGGRVSAAIPRRVGVLRSFISPRHAIAPSAPIAVTTHLSRYYLFRAWPV